jgi:putative sigma-54 modulation protein
MKLAFSGKNLALTDALRAKVEKKVAGLEKFTGPMVSAHVSFEVEHRAHHAELVVHCPGERIYKGKGMADDMYMAVNEAVAAVEQQAKKEKGKRLSGRTRRVKGSATEPAEEAPEEEAPAPAPRGPRLSRRDELFLSKPTTVNDAALFLEDRGLPLVVFREAETDRLLVLFREGKGSLGLVRAKGRP